MVRAASFAVADQRRGAVTLTSVVPDDFSSLVDGGGVSATALLGPDEARQVARMLLEAADQAAAVGPPLYG